MTAPTNDSQELQTRHRLLEAAGEVFAEAGFQNATVREICKRAGANIAAVNYHFGDKERLYVDVLRHAHTCLRQPVPHAYAIEKLSASQRLRVFVTETLRGMFDAEHHGWHHKLMAREMVEPTIGLDAIVNENIRPRRMMLAALVREISDGKIDEPTSFRCAESIVGQCVFFFSGRPVLARLDPRRKFDAADLEATADHVTRFSLAAIAGLAEEGSPRRRGEDRGKTGRRRG